jgi:hypothetical protein
MSKVPEPSIEAYDGGDNPVVVVAEKPKKRWRGYIWDSFDKSPEERKFLFKLDAGLLTIACLGTSLCPQMNGINEQRAGLLSTDKQDISSSTSIKPTSSMPSCLGCKLALISSAAGR